MLNTWLLPVAEAAVTGLVLAVAVPGAIEHNLRVSQRAQGFQLPLVEVVLVLGPVA
jgi:hypothetical protein